MSDNICKYCRHSDFQYPEGGICHRYPPTVFTDEDSYACVQPIISEDDWCGEFIRKVN